MLVGHLVHATMVFPGRIGDFINSKKSEPTHSFHILNEKGEELSIVYTKADAEIVCYLRNAHSIERRPIFKQFT